MAWVPQYSFALCAYASGSAAVQNVEVDGSGNYSAPMWQFRPYSKEISLGDGTMRGAGWANAVWHWDVMTDAQRDWLRTFIPYESAELWVSTRTQDDNTGYSVFRCIGVWPTLSEEHDARRRVKFEIKFQRMTNT